MVHVSKSPANPNIDFDGHMKLAAEAAKHREARRLTEEDFIKMSREEGAVILDARSKEKFDILHIKGAVNLSFPDIDVERLTRHLPNKDARVLIYCNNNFIVGAPPTSVDVTKEDLAARVPDKVLYHVVEHLDVHGALRLPQRVRTGSARRSRQDETCARLDRAITPPDRTRLAGYPRSGIFGPP